MGAHAFVAPRAVVAAVSLALAAGVAALLRSAPLHGPLSAQPGLVVLVTVEAALLAVGVASTSLVRAPKNVGWAADGRVCLGLLVCLTAALVLGWDEAPVPLRWLSGIIVPLAVVVLLSAAERRYHRSWSLSLASGTVVALLAVAVALVRDPYGDPDCWADCSLEDVAPMKSAAAARALVLALRVSSVAVALIVCALAVVVTVKAARSGHAAPWPNPAIAVAAALTAVLTAAAVIPVNRDTVVGLAAAGTAAGCLFAALVSAQPAAHLRRRRELRRLVVALGEVPPLGALEATLARVLGDRDLQVAYWLPESERYVNTSGAAVAVDAGWVSLRRQGEPLAVIRLSRSDLDAAEVEELVGSAARLAIDNERLQAELRAQLAELQASRQRIVLAADDTRRGVERSIHDVVQAELIGALFELAGPGPADGPVAPGAAAADSGLAGRVRDMVGVLREFARGAHPAVLDASGLGPALEALTYETPVAVTVDCRLDHRPPTEVEHTAYALVHDWAMRAEQDLTVDVTATGDAVVVQIDGRAGEVSEELADRVGALGGMVTVEDGRLRAVLPCA